MRGRTVERHGQRVVGIEGAVVHHVPVRVQLRLHEHLTELGGISLNERIEDQVRAGEVRGDQRQDGRHGATLASARYPQKV